MNTIYISIRKLIATAAADAAIVSDNTGYQIEFDFDAEWAGYAIKTAVFVWYRDSLPYHQTVAFSGNTVAVPQLPPIGRLWVGVTAGDLQTTTPAEVPCLGSILSSGGQLPEAPTESEYAKIMELLRASCGASAYELAVNNGFVGTEAQWLASLQGAAAAAPVKGVDYFTEEDQAQIVEAVLAALPDGDTTGY